jgi:hypothetical protein
LGKPPELFEIDQFGPHLAEDFSTDELGGLFSTIDVVELVIGTVSAWTFGALAPAAGFTADIVLAGEAAWTHRSMLLELGFNSRDLGFQFFNFLSCFHIPLAYIC